MKFADFEFYCLFSPLLLLLQLLNILGNDDRKSYAGSQVWLSYLSLVLACGSNCGHKITDFVFLHISHLLLLYVMFISLSLYLQRVYFTQEIFFSLALLKAQI